MKNKILSLLAAAIAVGLLLAGCSAKSDAVYGDRAEATVEMTQAEGIIAPDSDENSASPSVDLGKVDTSGKKIIYTANIVIEVDDATETIKEISDAASELGGYVSNSTFNRDEDVASGTITIRIEPEQYVKLTAKIGSLGEVLESSLTSQDVTYDYVDIESRLSNAEAQETQLLAIMDKAVIIEDILKVRTELNTVQQEIEQYKGQLRYMDNMVGYSTVTIRVTEKYVPKEPEVKENEGVLARWSSSYVWKSVVKGFNNSVAFIVNFFSALLIFLSYVLIPVLIIATVVFALLMIIKKVRKTKGKVKSPGYPLFPKADPPGDSAAAKDPEDSQKT
jgi:hypothetical protein